jgi:hypothetical protein
MIVRLWLSTFNTARETNSMARDIDYAAIAVTNAIAEKFGRANDLKDLEVIAQDHIITVKHAQRSTEGTRHDLLAAIRAAETYDQIWQPPRAS